MTRPVFVGIAGGSGSGKTTIAQALGDRYAADQVVIVQLDAYYKDRKGLSQEERARINYDHPEAFDEPLILEQMQSLRACRAIDQPLYAYATHSRLKETRRVKPARVVVLEGILVLALESVLPLFDLKLYVDAPADVRILRRLRRDVAERGRTVDSVIGQYMETVRPMHTQFIAPTRAFADIILPGEGDPTPTVNVLRAWIDARLER